MPYYDMKIECRGRVRADDADRAMAIAHEQAQEMARHANLSDYMIDETEARSVALSDDQEED